MSLKATTWLKRSKRRRNVSPVHDAPGSVLAQVEICTVCPPHARMPQTCVLDEAPFVLAAWKSWQAEVNVEVAVGSTVGIAVGVVGKAVGIADGAPGSTVGMAVGIADGRGVGGGDGAVVGLKDGDCDGTKVGAADVGTGLGTEVGRCVGRNVRSLKEAPLITAVPLQVAEPVQPSLIM